MRLRNLLLVFVLCPIAVDYLLCARRRSQTLAVVANHGGHVGGIGGWPIGAEKVISFERALTEAELKDLAILNDLVGRDHVSVYFNCELTPQQAAMARSRLSECHVHLATKGE